MHWKYILLPIEGKHSNCHNSTLTMYSAQNFFWKDFPVSLSSKVSWQIVWLWNLWPLWPLKHLFVLHWEDKVYRARAVGQLLVPEKKSHLSCSWRTVEELSRHFIDCTASFERKVTLRIHCFWNFVRFIIWEQMYGATYPHLNSKVQQHNL